MQCERKNLRCRHPQPSLSLHNRQTWPPNGRSYDASLSLLNSRYFTMAIALFQQSREKIPCYSIESVGSFYRKNELTLFNRVYVSSLYMKNGPTKVPLVSLKFYRDRIKLSIQRCLCISLYFPINNPSHQFFYKWIETVSTAPRHQFRTLMNSISVATRYYFKRLHSRPWMLYPTCC